MRVLQDALQLWTCRAIVVTLGMLGLAAAQAGPAPAAAGGSILDGSSPWRMSALWNTPFYRDKDGALQPVPSDQQNDRFVGRTAALPADWMAPEFADENWSRWRANSDPLGGYGFWIHNEPGPTLATLCLRGRFAVDDPAKVKNLTLSLAFRGGAVVYVNGQEAARSHLRAGKIEPDAFADDYPREAFCHPDKPFRGCNYIMSEWGGHTTKYKDLLEKRIRRLENVVIDPKLLRKGVNVLAVEIHRAPYLDLRAVLSRDSSWSTAGFVSLALRAEAGVTPGARPAGIRVWAAPDMRRPNPRDLDDPLEPHGPVSIVGCRNGAFDGRVTIASDGPIGGVKAQAGDLKQTNGKSTIPAANVELYYTIRDDSMAMRYAVSKDGFWDSLAGQAPARQEPGPGGAGAMQSILVKVKIPPDAASGEYAGKIVVSADGLAAVDVPVEVKVIGWKLPDPRDFVSHLGLIQSPESVALQYKTPFWSEEHWKYMEESFKLLGEMGNNYVVVPLICRTHLGNSQSMVRWVRREGSEFRGQGAEGATKGVEPRTLNPDAYDYDFTIFDRYLDLAQKYQKVDVVCLQVFDMYLGCIQSSGGKTDWTLGRKSGPLVTLWDPATGKASELEGPTEDAPEACRKFWSPVFKEITARLAKRGLSGATMLGISGDYGGGGHPTKELTALYAELLPGARWVANPHSDCRRGNMFGIPIGYNTAYYLSICPPPGEGTPRHPASGAIGNRFYGWNSKWKTDYHTRARGPTEPLTFWRVTQEAALVHGFSGRGRTGADFWPVLKPSDWKDLKVLGTGVSREKKSNSIVARYPESDWSQLNLDRGTENMFTPGPKGALPSEHSEQMRLGIQETEARIFVEQALLGKKLNPELARKCQATFDRRTLHLRGLGGAGGAGAYEDMGGRLLHAWFEGAGSSGLAEKLYAAAAEAAGKSGDD